MRMLRALLFCIISCFGQAEKAQLFGTILDPSGLAVAGAKVEAQEQGTQARFAAVSDHRGEYHLLGLPAGHYVVTVEQPGFRTHKQSGITLRIADKAALNVTLQVGQPAQSVEVTAEAPLLQTATGEVSYNVD